MMRIVVGLLLIAALVALAACNKPSAEECNARIGKLKARFETLPSGDFAPLDKVPKVSLPAVQGPKMVVDRGPIVQLAPGKIDIEGFQAANIAEFETKLSDVEKLETKLGYKNKAAYLALDHDVKVSEIIEPLCTLAKFRRPFLMVAAPQAPASPLPPPQMPQWLDEKMAEMNKAPAEQKPKFLAEAMTRAIGRCEPMGKWFEEVATVAPDRRTNVLKVLVLKGVEECECDGLDADALEALTVYFASNPGPSWALPAPIDCEKPSRSVELPAEATVSVLAKALAEGPATGSVGIKIFGGPPPDREPAEPPPVPEKKAKKKGKKRSR